jgi:S-adenosylmethionine:tRNA ribosyltransferase-isomerase
VETLVNYDYQLPKELIAQEPTPRRTGSRLLQLDRTTGSKRHGRFEDLPLFFRPGDVLVLNDTRVIPARIEATRKTGGRVELFLLERSGAEQWIVLAKPSGRLKALETLELVGGGFAHLDLFRGGGEWLVSFDGPGSREELFSLGRMPLPHYIERAGGADPRDSLDRERYQTVYAASDGAVAAPTAGLHFTESLLSAIEASGVVVVRLTLHVGIGTFAPVREEDFRKHKMHEERFVISERTADAVNRARRTGGRVVAVGTTSARVLETVARDDGIVEPGAGRTGIYIYPPYRFKAVDGLVTNFHLPKSTLLFLVSALAGRENIMAAYAEAVAERYRFFSYGDAMLIV